MGDLKPNDVRHTDGQVTRNGVRYGCHVDADRGEPIDGCVLDYDYPSCCEFGIFPSGRERKSRWTCPHWRKVSP